MADISYIPDQNQGNNYLPWMLAGNGGFGGFGGGWGSLLAGGLGGILAGALFPGLFNGNGLGGNGAGAAGFISNQLNNDAGRELIMQAIQGNTSALHDIASTIGADFNLVQSGINGLNASLASVGSSVGMSALQVVNAIQSGNADLASRFAQCCCDNKLLATEAMYKNQISNLEQTNALSGQAERNTNSIIGAINAQTVAMDNQFCALKEREMQSKIDTQADIITQLRGQIDNANQTAAISNYVNGLVAPLSAKVNEIANKMPQTVPVQYPNLQVYSTTPNMSPLFGAGYGYGYGVPGGSYWG